MPALEASEGADSTIPLRYRETPPLAAGRREREREREREVDGRVASFLLCFKKKKKHDLAIYCTGPTCTVGRKLGKETVRWCDFIGV